MRELLDTHHILMDCAACAPSAAPGAHAAQEAADAQLPAFNWVMLERQLHELVQRPDLARTITPMLCSLRRRSAFMAADAVLRELLCLAWVILEENETQDDGGRA